MPNEQRWDDPLHSQSPLYYQYLPQVAQLNTVILQAYETHKDDPDNRRSHYLAGRYENCYIAREKLPMLEGLLAQVQTQARVILGVDPETPLKLGFWFNAMHTGQRTFPHSHDNDDERLSAVYYVQVPPDSGTLRLHQAPLCTQLTPEAGLLVLFDPEIEHEVTENRSAEMRLSIAMNIGIKN